MSNFEGIKKGDRVLVRVSEHGLNAWKPEKTFMVLAIVKRVTKTQFTVEGGRRFVIESGREIAGRYYGQTVEPWDPSKNQESERVLFVADVKRRRALMNGVSGLELEKTATFEQIPPDKLDRLENLFDEIGDILKK